MSTNINGNTITDRHFHTLGNSKPSIADISMHRERQLTFCALTSVCLWNASRAGMEISYFSKFEILLPTAKLSLESWNVQIPEFQLETCLATWTGLIREFTELCCKFSCQFVFITACLKSRYCQMLTALAKSLDVKLMLKIRHPSDICPHQTFSEYPLQKFTEGSPVQNF